MNSLEALEYLKVNYRRHWIDERELSILSLDSVHNIRESLYLIEEDLKVLEILKKKMYISIGTYKQDCYLCWCNDLSQKEIDLIKDWSKRK